MATFIDSTVKIQRKRDITRRDLDVFFQPRSVAVIGATDRTGHVGRTVLWNLISSPFGGTVYPVNSKKSSVLGIRAYANVASLPEPPELAVLMTPAETVPGLIEECASVGVRGAVVISAGFRAARHRTPGRVIKKSLVGCGVWGLCCTLGWLSRGRSPRVRARTADPRCG